MITIAICDDNPYFAGYLESQLAAAPVPGLRYEVFLSGDELLKYMETNNVQFHIYFLDIEMPGSNGILTANAIRKSDKHALILFLTSHREYVYQVFEALPFRFLSKPVSENDLREALYAAMNHILTTEKLFFFRTRREQFQIPYEDICYFESRAHKIKLYTDSDPYEFYGKLGDICPALDQTLFCRIHSSYIVNMEQIRSIGETELTMRGKAVLPISKAYRKSVRSRHMEFMKWRCGH